MPPRRTASVQPATPVPPYKELTLSLLRVFREVARCASQAAAARRIGLSQPTIWGQMHSLERLLDAKLYEVRGRSSVLTADGERLLRLAQPILERFDALPTRFAEERGVIRQHLRVASTPRCMQEDLPQCIVEFESRFPDSMLTIFESDDSEVPQRVIDRDVDIGIAPLDERSDWLPLLHAELAYEMEIFLVTPPDHPLAGKASVLPEDIVGYPVVNGPGTYYGPRMKALEATLQSSIVPRHVCAFYASTIRTLVKLGFGVGIVTKREAYPSDPELHERSLSRYAGRATVSAVTIRDPVNPLAQEFLKIVREILS